jgi:hypothetical protein
MLRALCGRNHGCVASANVDGKRRDRVYAISPRRARRSPRVMRAGKTRRDRESGAWASHAENRRARRLENKRVNAAF